MRIRWSLILPIAGLILFSAESIASIRFDRQNLTDSKLHFWSFIPLNSDPLNRTIQDPNSNGRWELKGDWPEPNYVTNTLIWSALPAFVLAADIVEALARVGVSELLSFYIAFPVLIFVWFYLVGGFIEGWTGQAPVTSHTTMRKRGVVSIAVTIPVWAYLYFRGFIGHVPKGLVGLAAHLAFLGAAIGVVLSLSDMFQWIRLRHKHI